MKKHGLISIVPSKNEDFVRNEVCTVLHEANYVTEIARKTRTVLIRMAEKKT